MRVTDKSTCSFDNTHHIGLHQRLGDEYHNLLFTPHRSTTYVDAPHCYGRSSVVCQSVCRSVTTVGRAETDEPIEMLFDLDSGGPKEPLYENYDGN